MSTTKNKSGIHPTRDLVLIEPEQEVESKEGLIIIPDGARERERLAQIFGRIVEIGDVAFCYEDKNYGSKIRDKMLPGTRVLFAKYHGIVVFGQDKKQYRLIQDDDVAAIVTEKVQKKLDS